MAKKVKSKKLEVDLESLHRQNRIRNRWFILIIIVFTYILYGNSIPNFYNIDDYHVIENNAQAAKGISGIPEIFSTLYAEESGLSYGYRPIVRMSFAIDYQFFGNLEWFPYINHFINVFLYMLAMVLLYIVLKKIFRKMNPFFPFLITLLFMAHPLHTEVVASLKSRDEILALIFCLLAMQQFLRWANLKKTISLIFGSVFLILAILSKETAFSFLLIFPLTMYFFTSIKPQRLWLFTFIIIFVAVFAFVVPQLFLTSMSREQWMIENPLIGEGFFTKVATGFYVLLLYLKKLIYPLPMLFYYGYNMVPVKTLANGWVILSLLFYLGIFVFAVMKFRKKQLLSYIILFFLITIAMFSNIIRLVPGIMADRFMFFPSLAFSMFIAYFLFWLFRADIHERIQVRKNIIPVIVVVIIILLPFTTMTIDRNKDWRTRIDLYEHDIKDLKNSVKANDLLATEITTQVTAVIQSEPINVAKFQMPAIRRAIELYNNAIDIYPAHYSSYYNLGFIYSELMAEYTRSLNYFRTAISNEANKEEPYYPRAHYYLGRTFEQLENYDSAVYYYRKAHELNPHDHRPMASAVYASLTGGDKNNGMMLYEQMKVSFPDSDLPYVCLGVYYLENQDTLQAIDQFRQALQISEYPSINILLYNFYRNQKDWAKTNFFYTQAKEEMRRIQEERAKQK